MPEARKPASPQRWSGPGGPRIELADASCLIPLLIAVARLAHSWLVNPRRDITSSTCHLLVAPVPGGLKLFLVPFADRQMCSGDGASSPCIDPSRERRVPGRRCLKPYISAAGISKYKGSPRGLASFLELCRQL